jgi:hypothetical protein
MIQEACVRYRALDFVRIVGKNTESKTKEENCSVTDSDSVTTSNWVQAKHNVMIVCVVQSYPHTRRPFKGC